MAMMRMKTTGCARSHQQGISLIEALLATLLLVVLLAGTAHVLSRGLVSQRYMSAQSLALLEIREQLQQRNDITPGSCSAPTELTWVGNVSLTGSCNIVPTSISIPEISASIDVDAPSITLTTEGNAAQGLFGGDGIIEVSDN